MSLRSKRLASALDPDVSAFLDSTREDAALLRDDILGSLAHVAVLEGAKVVTGREAAALRAALVELHQGADAIVLEREHEDVHMNVEVQLTRRVGELGKKLHTARSRNDQVALDLRLWTRRTLVALAHEAHAFALSLIATARDHTETAMPGHTHFQIGQPVSLGHTLGAHAARLVRDLDRIEEALRRLNVSPLGAGALAGTSFKTDPRTSADLLGFDRAFHNSLDAVSDRDFVHDALYAASLLLNHVSGLAEELILFTHPAFGFATIDDAHATGSSLMPQKKNPDVLEVARAKAATLAGALVASLATTKALPFAYNRDLQEQKRLVLDTLPEAVRTVRVVHELVAGLRFHPERMETLAGAGYSDATELADYLVRKGVPFRDAHAQAAECVQVALRKGVTLGGLDLADLRAVNPRVAADVFKVLGPLATLRAKTSPGGTAPASAEAALVSVRADLRTRGEAVARWRRRLADVEARLTAPPRPVRAR